MMEVSRQKTTAAHTLETAREIRLLSKKMYASAHEAKKQGKKIAWTMVCIEHSILKSLDIVAIYPEHWGALCAAKKREISFLEKAESEGFLGTCNYCRLTLGFACLWQETGTMPPDAPDGGLPEPDMLIANTECCDPRYKFFQALARYKNVPYYFYDVQWPPPRGEVKSYYIQYNIAQLKQFIASLERETGRKMDWGRLEENVNLEYETLRVWSDVYQMRKRIPSPMPSEDHFAIIVPYWYMTYEPETLPFYKRLRDEVRQRVENKRGVIPEEKYRLLWNSGLPPWHNMWLFNFLESLGAVSVMETVLYPGDPLETGKADLLEKMVWRNGKRWHWVWGRHTEEELVELIKEYKVDAVITHALKSCRSTTIGMIHEGNAVRQMAGIPTLYIQSDMVDSREYSEALIKRQIEDFIETIETYKRRGGK